PVSRHSRARGPQAAAKSAYSLSQGVAETAMFKRADDGRLSVCRQNRAPAGSASSSHADDAMMRRSGKRMTLVELKRHMDRRFDRLQRTKADKADLQRFATKDGLKRFATKDDLESLKRLVGDVLRKVDGLHDKVDSLVRIGNDRYGVHQRALSDHEYRLRELEGHPIG